MASLQNSLTSIVLQDLRRKPFLALIRSRFFLFLPFCGDTFSARIRDRIRSATALAYPAAALRLVCGTRRVPIRSLKDRSPPLSASNLIYEFKCSCGSRYLGRTERRLSVRIGEHLPKWLMMGRLTGPRSSCAPSSAVARHALACGEFDRGRQPDAYFSVRARPRHPRLLPMLESALILAERPPLCVQKDFLFTLALPWT